MLLGYTSPKCWSLFYRLGYRSFLHLAQNSRWRLDEWHHNVNISSNMGWTLKTKERVGAWRIFLWFMILWFFFGYLCFLKSISITKTIRMNRTLACFQKNEIISNFSRIYFWPLFFRIGSEFDKISGWVGCKSIPILSSHP